MPHATGSTWSPRGPRATTSPSAGRGWRWASPERRPWSARPRRWAWAPGSPDARGGTRTHTPLRTIGLKPIASRQFRHPGLSRIVGPEYADSAMITAEHVEEYLRALSGERSEVMAEMEAHAERDQIPIVPWETGRLL